jgi:hypothetical protein
VGPGSDFTTARVSLLRGKRSLKPARTFNTRVGLMGLPVEIELQHIHPGFTEGAESSAPIEESGSHMTCMGLSPVKGLFALAGQLIWDCCLGFADSSLFGAEKAVLRPVAYDQVPGARGRGQGTETLA